MPYNGRYRLGPDAFWKQAVRQDNGCLVWTGCKLDRDGYGRVWWDGRVQKPHRVAYQLVTGPIADGLVIDHLCRNPPCVNPEHLEAVSPAENNRRGNSPTAKNARKIECIYGHPFDSVNTYWRPDGTGRMCKRCQDRRHRAARHQQYPQQRDECAS